MNLIPMVIKKHGSDERSYDIFSACLKDRVIFCNGEINADMAANIQAQLLYLESEDPNAPITMIVQGPGGRIDAGFSIISTMNMIKCPVHTIASGSVASMSAVIVASGEKGQRGALPNTRIMIHQSSGGTRGRFTDVEVDFEEHKRVNKNILQHLADCCGKKYDVVVKDCEKDYWMDESEAKKYGIIDKIVTKK